MERSFGLHSLSPVEQHQQLQLVVATSIVTTMSGKISAQIKQTKPLPSLETEAIINLLRTSSIVEQVCGEPLKAHDLTNSQYNVLRILRGAGENGHACQELAARMIRRDPDVTRLLDRLE